MSINLAAPIVGNIGATQKPGEKPKYGEGAQTNAYDKFLDQNLKETVEMMFKVMVKQAQSMMPGDDKQDIAQSVIAVANGIQMAKTNKSMEENTAVGRGIYGMSMANLEGHKVMHETDTIEYDGLASDIVCFIPGNAVESDLVISDSSGQPVYTKRFSAKETGRQKITWDGIDETTGQEVPKGDYTFFVRAIDKDNKALKTQSYLGSFVTEVEFDDKGAPRLLSGDRVIQEIQGFKKYMGAKPVLVMNQPQQAAATSVIS